MSKIVGIDLGTTNSLVAIVENGHPRVLARDGQRLIPSVVGLTDDGRMVVGQEALNQYALAPERTVRSVKRKMGTGEMIMLGEREYAPEEISAFILRSLKQLAEEALNDKVERAVITVPAYFNDTQRNATKRAGELAGLEVVRIINEPTAAALAYGVTQQHDQFLLVYDLGGGTFDVSIIEQQGDVLEVRASHGNVHLGGDDFDERLLKQFLLRLAQDHRYDFQADRRAMARLSQAAEKAKIALSTAPYTRVAEEFLARYEGKIAHLDLEVARDDFADMIADLLAATVVSLDKALADAELSADQLHRVLLVGGSTRIPRVWELIREHIGLEPALEVDPDEAVALGAAVQAAIVSGAQVNAMLIDVAPHSLGIEIAKSSFFSLVPGHFRPIIRRNTAIPTTQSERFYTVTPAQDTVEIKVFQGESPLCSENTELGKFMFADIPPGEDPSQAREIIVEFSYNLNGIMEVTMLDRSGARREVLQVNTSAVRRAASEPELKKRFAAELEKEIAAALQDAAQLELQCAADHKQKEAARLHKARHALQHAYTAGKEKHARKALEALEALLYEMAEDE